ncbi:ribosome maturation factor RimM [soil metagenome]
MEEPALLEVGRVAKAHGLGGAVVVSLVSDRVERLEPGSVLATDAGPLTVVSARPHQHRFIVAFEGLTPREKAEAVQGLVLRAPPLDDPDALWVHELVGAEVVTLDGRRYGRVEAVEANPADDLLVLEDGALVPVAFVVGWDSERCLLIDPPEGLLD